MISKLAMSKSIHALLHAALYTQHGIFNLLLIIQGGKFLNCPLKIVLPTHPFSSLIIQGQKFLMIGKELMKNNSERLDYNFIFKPLEPTVYYDDGYTYSMAQLELRFSRTEKSKNQIFGGYYAGTLTFASLSLVSFFIHPDMVPGRMGMLIMLYLIQVNTYGSLDAPPKRGFSSIEVKVKPKVSKT